MCYKIPDERKILMIPVAATLLIYSMRESFECSGNRLASRTMISLRGTRL